MRTDRFSRSAHRVPARMQLLVASLFLLSLGWMPIASANDLQELRLIHAADQGDRSAQPGNGPPVDWTEVAKRDQTRTHRVLELRERGQIKTENDHLRAVTVLLHGPGLAHIVQAYGLAETGRRLYPGNQALLRLRATAWDRLRMAQGRPQWFGTQLIRMGSGPVQLYEMDRTIMTERERVALGGQSDIEMANALAAEATGVHGPEVKAVEKGSSKIRLPRLVWEAAAIKALMATHEAAAQFYAQATTVGIPVPGTDRPPNAKRYLYLPLKRANLEQFAATGVVSREPGGLVDDLYASVADVASEMLSHDTLVTSVQIDDRVLAAPKLVVQYKATMVWKFRVMASGELALLQVRDVGADQVLLAAE